MLVDVKIAQFCYKMLEYESLVGYVLFMNKLVCLKELKQKQN